MRGSAAPGAAPRAGDLGGLRLGVPVTVRVPASSANLGPGFDSLGLALDLVDRVSVQAFDPGSVPVPGIEVVIEGEGAAAVPLDDTHLVVATLRAALQYVGVGQPALRLNCCNAIPHGRGLGSSSAAILAGLVAARGLLVEPDRLSQETILDLASQAEGHPDNASASLLGGFTVSWFEPVATSARPRRARAVRLEVDASVRVAVCVPAQELATSRARAMLPTHVPHADAAFNAGRAALLVQALTRRPDLLLAATEDRLHQQQRAAAMPHSTALVAAVRAAGGAAVISGAGPSVLVLGVGRQALEAASTALAAAQGTLGRWHVLEPAIDLVGSVVTDGPGPMGTTQAPATL